MTELHGVEMTENQRQYFMHRIGPGPCNGCRYYALWIGIVPRVFIEQGVDDAIEASDAIRRYGVTRHG